MHVSTLRSSGFKAAEGGGPPSRLLGFNVMRGEALSSFLCNWPSRSRNLSIGRFPARLQKPLKGRGHKVLSLWFAQQPFDGRAGIKLDLSQPLEIGLAISTAKSGVVSPVNARPQRFQGRGTHFSHNSLCGNNWPTPLATAISRRPWLAPRLVDAGKASRKRGQ